MKYKYMFVLLEICLFCGCADDKGNYDYNEINEVAVTGVENGKWYTKVAYIDRLAFNPEIESSTGKKDESAYEYEWKLMPKGKDFDLIEDVDALTVSRSRELDMEVDMAPGDYTGFFIVKDKETGVSWSTRFYVQVKSMTSEGWMVLCEENGHSRMDIVFNSTDKEDLVAHNIWKESEFIPGKPVRILYNYFLSEPVSLLVTDKGTYILDKLDLHAGEDNDLKWRFGVIPESIKLLASGTSLFSGTNYWAIVDEHNDVYTLNRSVDRSVFEFPVNSIDGKEPFKAAPFVGVSYDDDYYGNGYGCLPILLYDTTHEQFVVIRNNSAYPSIMTFTGKQQFPAKTGREMLYMESTKPGRIYAILRDPATRQPYFYGMKLCANYKEPDHWWEEGEYEEYNIQEYYGEVKGDGVSEATVFACHHLYPYLFYVSGSKVFQFDMGHPDVPAKEVLNFPGEDIKVLKFNVFAAWEAYQDWERARNYQLIVGTNVQRQSETEYGVMRVYDVPNLMEPLIKVKEFTGLGKIVDIAYKERGKN